MTKKQFFEAIGLLAEATRVEADDCTKNARFVTEFGSNLVQAISLVSGCVARAAFSILSKGEKDLG